MNPNLVGDWKYQIKLKRVPFWKLPIAGLGKALNEAVTVTLEDSGIAKSTMRGTEQLGKWSVDGDRFMLDTGHGEPVYGKIGESGDSVLLESRNGEFGDELSRSIVRLIKISR